MAAISPLVKLNGCCSAHVEVFAAMMVVESCRMIVDYVCLQETAAAGISWQLTASAAWDYIVRRRLRHHGATWLAADCGGLSSLAGLSGAVYLWKMAQVTSLTC